MRRILAALDSSPRTTFVFDAALDLAKQYRVPMVLFRAVDVPPEFPPAAATHVTDALRPKLVADATHELGQLAARAKSAGVEASVDVVVSSEPWRAIIDAAGACDVDAIVVGSHGYHAIDRLLGTNAARVADRAPCLVVVVHEPRTPS
jgi:nucleotide-binding universal stress UspA family protein